MRCMGVRFHLAGLLGEFGVISMTSQADFHGNWLDRRALLVASFTGYSCILVLLLQERGLSRPGKRNGPGKEGTKRQEKRP